MSKQQGYQQQGYQQQQGYDQRQGYDQQQGYQYAPDGEDYGFASRLPQAGGSHQTDKVSSSSSGAAGVSPMAYPPPAYAGAPVTGHPVMTPPMAGGMARPLGMGVEDPQGRRDPATTPSVASGMSGPLGMGAEDPLGRRDRKRARRQQGRQQAGGANRLRRKLVLLLVAGPLGLPSRSVRKLARLVRHAIQKGKKQTPAPPAPAHHPGSSN